MYREPQSAMLTNGLISQPLVIQRGTRQEVFVVASNRFSYLGIGIYWASKIKAEILF